VALLGRNRDGVAEGKPSSLIIWKMLAPVLIYIGPRSGRRPYVRLALGTTYSSTAK
jgi:hypothetical protein